MSYLAEALNLPFTHFQWGTHSYSKCWKSEHFRFRKSVTTLFEVVSFCEVTLLLLLDVSKEFFKFSASRHLCFIPGKKCLTYSSDSFTNLKFRIYDFFNEYLLWFLFQMAKWEENLLWINKIFFQLWTIQILHTHVFWDFLKWPIFVPTHPLIPVLW